jgi:hypothetical protein
MADTNAAAAKERVARIKRGETVAGGLGKPTSEKPLPINRSQATPMSTGTAAAMALHLSTAKPVFGFRPMSGAIARKNRITRIAPIISIMLRSRRRRAPKFPGRSGSPDGSPRFPACPDLPVTD